MDKKYTGAVYAMEGKPPDEFLIWRYGAIDFAWDNGDTLRINFSPTMAAAIVEASLEGQTGGDLHIDYQHRTDIPVDNSPAPAAGWFRLEARSDGLYATNVKWTDKAANMLSSREFRYFSPVFYVTDNKTIVSIAKLSLTNEPATKGLLPLVASSDSGSVAQFAQQPYNAGRGIMETAENSNMSALGAVLSLGDSASLDAIVSEVQRLKAVEAAFTDAKGRLSALETEVSALKLAQAVAQAGAIVDEALKDHKITASQRQFWLDYAKTNPEGARAYFASATPIIPATIENISSQSGNTMGDLEVKRIAQQLRLTDDDIKLGKERLGGKYGS